jgi:hypothetical protein
MHAHAQAVYKKHNKVLPDDPWEQLRMGIDAVFRCVCVCVVVCVWLCVCRGGGSGCRDGQRACCGARTR